MARKILVTGGVGYIGSHTVVELINEGFEVLVVDNLFNSKIEILEGIKNITGIKPKFDQFDICDKDQLFQYFDNNTVIEAIIHFAAFKSVGESVDKPLKYYRNNLNSLMNLLEAMPYFNIPNIVFSSSCTVYGEPDELPVTEESPVKRPNSPYGNTKRISEEVIHDFLEKYKSLNAIALRYFNPIGAHKSVHIGELPLGIPDNLVPYITQTAIGLRDELKVFGDDYNTPDGSCIRDYIDVVDLARAHVIAIKRLLNNDNKNNFEVFNLGTGKGMSVLEIVNAFQKATGKELNYRIVGRRSGDVPMVYADTSYANEELGWIASTPLEETLRSAWEWEKNYRKNIEPKLNSVES
jgi:UDP-glucose 4-epimerase